MFGYHYVEFIDVDQLMVMSLSQAEQTRVYEQGVFGTEKISNQLYILICKLCHTMQERAKELCNHGILQTKSKHDMR